MAWLVIASLVPVVLLLALGQVLRRHVLVEDAFWAGAERLAYVVLLPALFLHGVASADLSGIPVVELAAVLVGSTVAIAIVAVLLRPVIGLDGAAFTSLFQGSIRFNNYIGVTVASGILGPRGVAFAAICNAVIVPTVNLLCVLAFALYGTERPGVLRTLREIGTNPLILACAGGAALRAIGGLPTGLDSTLQSLGSASMPLGLLCVGAALRFTDARRWARPVLAASTLKFIAMPGATVLLATPVGLTADGLAIAVLFNTLPTASSAYILARRLGGDAPLMAGIIAVQTLLGLAAVPVALSLAL